MKTFFSVSLPCKIHLKKYFQHLVLHVKYFLENCQKPYLIQANPSKNKSIATKYKLLLLPQTNHVNKIKPHYMSPIKSQILREKKDVGLEGWVDGDGSMEVGQRRMRTRDGSVKMRDGSAGKLACTTEGSCVDRWFWASLVVPSPCSTWAWRE